MSGMNAVTVPLPGADVRPLPAKPNLEFERKRAKKLLAQMRRTSTNPVKLADAQFAIAREYGFMNWPLLVRYYEELARQELPDRPEPGDRSEFLDQRVQSMLKMHRKRSPYAAMSFATFIPRFFGHKIATVMDSEVTLDDARLVIARSEHAGSWEALKNRRVWKGNTGFDYFESWQSDLRIAFKNRDLALLQKIVTDHPEALDSKGTWVTFTFTLADSALQSEIVHSAGQRGEVSFDADSRKLSDWLLARGVDFSAALAKQLIGWQMMAPETVQYWLDRGADPNLLPPNGIPILEHAAYRYMNGAALDILAKRVTPRKLFWLAAALGDVRSVARYFKRDGSLTDAARRNRPDFAAIGPGLYPHAPGAEDEYIIQEAFFVAAMNGRHNVLDLLLSKGYPIDHNIGWPLLNSAVNMENASLVEFLVSRGANVDVEDFHGGTARKRAEMHWYENQTSETTNRMLRACSSNDKQEIIRAYDAVQQKQKPGLAPMMTGVFNLARISASRNGRKEVELEDVFIAMLSEESGMPLMMLSEAGLNIKELRRLTEKRLVTKKDGEDPPDIPLSAKVDRIMQIASERAEQRKHYVVTPFQLLAALIADESGEVAATIRTAGGDISRIIARLESNH